MSKEFSALVINLASARQRRRFQETQFERLGIDYCVMNAVTPDNVDPAEMQSRMHSWARPLRPTEVACLLSHRTAWQVVSRSSEPLLIVEDDVVFQKDIKTLLAALREVTDVDYVNLETVDRPKLLGDRRSRLGGTGYSMSALIRDRAGAGAYLLWPSGAEKLLSYTEFFSPLADSALNLAPSTKRLQIEPAAAIQAFLINASQAHKSTTASGKKPKYLGWNAAALGKLKRLRISFSIGARQIASLGQSSNRIVPFDANRACMSSAEISSI